MILLIRLRVNSAIANLIASGKSAQILSLIESGSASGMRQAVTQAIHHAQHRSAFGRRHRWLAGERRWIGARLHPRDASRSRDQLPHELRQVHGKIRADLQALRDGCTIASVVELAGDERQELIDYMVTEQQLDGTLVESPLTGDNMDERVRGVLFILAQHPSYHIR